MKQQQRIDPETYRRWRETPVGSTTERLERQLVARLLEPVADRRLLDVGTGDGTYAIEMAERGAEVTGVDIEPRMLEAGRRRADEEGADVEFVRGDVRDLPFEDGAFNRVVAVTVLCFVPDPERAFDEMARVLAPGGKLVVGELARWSIWAASRRIRGWFGSDLWSSAHFWTREELKDLLEGAGLEVERIEGAVHYPPLDAAARLFEPVDPTLGRVGAPGAAFLAACARRTTEEPTE